MADPCRRHRLWMSDQIDGQPMPFFSGLLYRLHQRLCPRCRRVERSLLATRDVLSALRDIDPKG